MSEAATQTPLEWRAMQTTERDIALYGDCFARNDERRDARLLRWLHLENPTGRTLVELAVAGGSGAPTIAGIYAVMPVWARVGGKRVLACQSLDTLTDKAFRGQGLFMRMAGAAFSRAERDGHAFVYGFPNGNSARGFFGRLAWTQLDPVPFLVRPLRSGLAMRRLAPKLPWVPDLALPAGAPRLASDQDLRSIARFSEPHEEVWNAFAAGIGVAVDRDACYLNWRLRDKPGHTYRIVALHERGRVLGFAASVVAPKHGGRIGYLMELMHLPDRPDAGVVLAQAAVHDMAQQRADLVFAWNFPHSPNHAALARAGFVTFPERLRPVELHFGARAFLGGDTAAQALDRSAWYISYLDSDTV